MSLWVAIRTSSVIDSFSVTMDLREVSIIRTAVGKVRTMETRRIVKTKLTSSEGDIPGNVAVDI